ncbi:hypothetical protein D9M68_439160 [compost metagenome]
MSERQHRRTADFRAQGFMQIGIGHEPRRAPRPAAPGGAAQRARGNRVDAVDHDLLRRDERPARQSPWEREPHIEDRRRRPDLLAADRGEPVERVVADDIAQKRRRNEDEIRLAEVLGSGIEERRLDLALRGVIAEMDEDNIRLLAQPLQVAKHVRQHARAQEQIDRRPAAGHHEWRKMHVVRLAGICPEGRNDIVEAQPLRLLGRVGEERDRRVFGACEEIARALLVLEVDEHRPLEQRSVALPEEAYGRRTVAVGFLEPAFRPQAVFKGRLVARRADEAVFHAGEPEFPVFETVLPVVVETNSLPEDIDGDHRARVADVVGDAVNQPGIVVAVVRPPAHREGVDIGVDPAGAALTQLAVKGFDRARQNAIVGVEKIDGLCFRQVFKHIVDGAVARAARPCIAAEDHVDVRMSRRKQQQLIEGLVPWVTIDRDDDGDPAIRKRRSQCGLDCLECQRRVPVERHGNRDQIAWIAIAGHEMHHPTALPSGSPTP